MLNILPVIINFSAYNSMQNLICGFSITDSGLSSERAHQAY